MLIRAPMLGKEQRRIGGNFSHIDLVPTLLDILGQEVPQHLQGERRVPVLRGETDLRDNDVFIEWSRADGQPPASIGEAELNRSMVHPLSTIISAERWKLKLYGKEEGELYDLNADPQEL